MSKSNGERGTFPEDFVESAAVSSSTGPEMDPTAAPYNSADWQPIQLTLVEYPKGDFIGEVLAWISLVPLVICAGFGTLILFRRDLHTISFFGGQMLNEILNKVLKYTIREPRPITRQYTYTEYGMPSNHSQFVGFFSSYVLLFVLIRLPPFNQNAFLERFWRLLIIGGTWFVALLVCYSRVYLQYHTWAQVVAGLTIGLLTGALWFCVTQFILSPLFPRIVSWKLSEQLLLRDTTLIPNVLWFEYTATRKEANARSRKLNGMKAQ